MTTAHADLGLLVPGSERTLGTRIESLRAAWTRHLAYRATLADLADLTDRQLTDVGASRVTLKRFAKTAIYGK